MITDCFVIASASNERQVNAIVDEVEEKMRLAGYKPARREGAREGRWTLLDFVDIVVHIQHQDERNFYALDRLWRDCPIVPVDLDGAGAVTIRRLVMLRHGQTEYNAGNRMQGQLDTDLSDLGRDQAVAAAEVLAKRQPLLIVSSDLRRALDTAESLGERSGLPVEVDARLRETHLGDWQGMTHIEVDAAAPGARIAWRNDATWAPHGGESRVDVAARGMPLVSGAGRRPDRVGHRRTRTAGGAGRARRADRRADGGAAGTAGGQLAGAGRHGQRQLGAAVRAFRRRRGASTISGGASTCGTPRHRSPTMSSEPTARATLLVFCDSLSYYGPTGGLPADDPRIWPNIVAAQLGWDVELIGRIGWTCRDVWWAATQDPRAWAALPRAGAVIFATGGMDSLPSPLPTALRELIRYVRPPWLRRWVRDGYGWVQPRLSPIARAALPPHVSVEYLETDPRGNRFQPAGHPDRRVAAVGAHRRDVRQGTPRQAGHGQGDHRMGRRNTTFRWST